MKKKFTFFLLFLSLFTFNSICASEVVNIGILIDSREEEIDGFINKLEVDLTEILGADYRVEINPINILNSNWSAKTAAKNFESLKKNSKIDFILGLGTLTSTICLKNRSYPKPLILVGVIDPVLQGLAKDKQEYSGIANLTYVYFNNSLERDFKTLHRIYPYKKIGMIVSSEIIEVISALEEKLNESLKSLDVTMKFIPVKNNIKDVYSKLNDVDAVYVGYLGRLEFTSKDELIKEINRRKLPSFGGSIAEVGRGLLAASIPVENESKLRRRIALNIESLLNGEEAAKLSVCLSYAEKLTINMATAKLIDLSPKFSILAEAELINNDVYGKGALLSIENAIRAVLDNNLELKIEQENVDAAMKEVALAKTNFSPKFGVGVNQLIVDHEKALNSFGNQAERTIAGKAKISQLLYSVSVRSGISIQRFKLIAAKKKLQEKKLDLVLEAATAYFDILRAKTAVKVQKENLDLTRKHLEISKLREAIGYSGISDVYRWESKIADVTTSMIQAKNDYRLTKINLNRIMQMDMSADFSVSEKGILEEFQKYYPQVKLDKYVDNPKTFNLFTEFQVKEAINISPEIKAIDANITAAKRNLKSLRRQRSHPTLSLNGESSHVFSRNGTGANVVGKNPQDDSWLISLDLNWNLYEGGAIRTNIKKAKIQIKQLQFQRKQIIQMVEQKVRSALLEMAVRAVSLETSKRSSKFAHKSLNLVQDSYAKGKVSIVDLVEAQTAALTSESVAINSAYNFINTVLKTERAMGEYIFMISEEEKKSYFMRLKKYLKLI